MTKKNENPGDIQEIFKVKKSSRWFQKNQKSRRYPGDFQEVATLIGHASFKNFAYIGKGSYRTIITGVLTVTFLKYRYYVLHLHFRSKFVAN